jgi:glycine oxidase
LKAETGIDYHFCPAPRINLAFTEAEVDELRPQADSQQKQGFKVGWLDRDSVLRMENRVSPEIIGAVYREDGAEIESYQYVLALAQAAEKYGAEIRHGKVAGLKRNGTRVTAIELPSGDIACERVILAMGPWTGLASSWLNFPVPVRPQRGQVLRIRASGPPLSYTLSWASHYVTQTRHDGLIYTGTTHEDVGFDDQPTEAGRDSIMTTLLTMVPSLVEAELVLQTACLRPLSVDELPIIGAVPGWSGVYLATGHWTKGILLSPITARIMTDLIMKGDTNIPIEALTPIRFTTR